MQWIRRGRQIGQAVKNVQRLRQIIAVLSKYGFVDIVDRVRLGKFLPSRLAAFAATQADKSPAERLRLSFEELGPTFVKLGQLLSTRSDLIPEIYIEEFTKLQDDVLPLSFDVVHAAVEKELGRKVETVFSNIVEKPLGSASISQAHEATLRTGEKVVIKVQRPEIGKIIDTDTSLLAFFASLLERYVPETRIVGPKMIVEEFCRTLSQELDFVIEANNMVKIAENMAANPDVVIPKVYREFSTQRLLIQGKLEGIRFNDLKALDAAGIDRKKIVVTGARAFFRSVMIDGVFHGDLHGGNLFVLPGDKIGIIDFGIVGRLSQKSRDQFANMVMSLLTEDYENLCYQYAELGASGAAIDFEGFQREVRNTLSPYIGLSLKDLNIGKILTEATRVAARYNIKVPGDWMLVFKAMLTVEGMGRSLDPDFDIISVGQDLVKDLVKSQYSVQRLSKDLLWVVKDVASLLQVLPRQVRWMFRKFNSNDFAFEIKSPDLRDLRVQLDLNGRRMSQSVVVASLFLASAVALHHPTGRMVGEYPLFFIIFFIAACLALINLVLKR